MSSKTSKRNIILSQARLRLCVRILRAAAEADPQLFEEELWKRSFAHLGTLSNQRAEVTVLEREAAAAAQLSQDAYADA